MLQLKKNVKMKIRLTCSPLLGQCRWSRNARGPFLIEVRFESFVVVVKVNTKYSVIVLTVRFRSKMEHVKSTEN